VATFWTGELDDSTSVDRFLIAADGVLAPRGCFARFEGLDFGLGDDASRVTGLCWFDNTECFAAVEIVLIWPRVASMARDTAVTGFPGGLLNTDAGCVVEVEAGVGVLRLSLARSECIEVVSSGECADGVIPFLSCGNRGEVELGVACRAGALDGGVAVCSVV
jgi:hypothetical protein